MYGGPCRFLGVPVHFWGSLWIFGGPWVFCGPLHIWRSLYNLGTLCIVLGSLRISGCRSRLGVPLQFGGSLCRPRGPREVLGGALTVSVSRCSSGAPGTLSADAGRRRSGFREAPQAPGLAEQRCAAQERCPPLLQGSLWRRAAAGAGSARGSPRWFRRRVCSAAAAGAGAGSGGARPGPSAPCGSSTC